MVAYNFQPAFIDPIMSGVKRSTIRRNRRRKHAVAGQALQLYTGQRTSLCRLLMRTDCECSNAIEIHYSAVFVNGVRKDNPAYFENLGKIEGFGTFSNLQAWFDHMYGLPVVNLTQILWMPTRPVLALSAPHLVEVA